MTALLAAILAGLATQAATAAALGGRVAPAGGAATRAGISGPRRSAFAVVVVATGAVAVVIVPMQVWLLGAVGASAAALGWRLLGARRRALAAQARAEQVVLACDAIAGDLGAGLPPGWALQRVARHWPEFAPVAVAADLGADVPDRLRDLAALPGADRLGVVAATWQVAHRSGSGLADALRDVAGVLREDAAIRRLVEGELAAARSTAQLMCALPGAVLLLGVGVGSHPWHFLFASIPGLACLAGGVLLDLAGLLWMQRIADGVLAP